MKVEGARCLVVSGARRLGAAVAVALAHGGADVALSTRSPASADAVAQAIESAGRRCVVVSGDVTARLDARHVVAAAALGLGGLDVLVFAASGPFSPVAPNAIDETIWDGSMDVIARGFLFTAQAAREQFLSAPEGDDESDNGVIVALTDTLASRPWPSLAAHYAAKAAQRSLIRSLAVAWAGDRIRICGVAPGPVELEDDEQRAAAERARERFGAQRLVHPDEVAAVIRMCIENRALTGVDLPVDAGASLA